MSKEKAVGGLAYVNIHGTKSKTTTAMWNSKYRELSFVLQNCVFSGKVR
jgi:hypothetical protein